MVEIAGWWVWFEGCVDIDCFHGQISSLMMIQYESFYLLLTSFSLESTALQIRLTKLLV